VAPRRQEAPRQRGRTEEDRQRAIAELRERAAAQIQALVTGEDWAAWLRMVARFPGWSFTNVLLIAAQRPAATLVASYEQWQAQGRQVRRNEPGIRVIAEPRPSAGKRGAFSPSAEAGTPDGTANLHRQERLTYVWDVGQTSETGHADRAAPLAIAGGMPPGLWDALTWLARREGFAAERADCGPWDSLTNWGRRRIQVRSGLDGPEAAWALLHELGHVLAHNSVQLLEASTAGCRGVRKVEADSIAFVVAARLRMDTRGCSWPQVASWAGSDPRARPEEAIRASGTRIATAAATIAAHLDVVLFGTPTVEAAPAAVHAPEPGRRVEAARERSGSAEGPVVGSRRAAEIDEASARLPVTDVGPVLLDAERFYLSRVERSWVPGYLTARGFSQATMTQWRIGYAPGGWTALTSYLRGLGYDDAAIQAAGLARVSSRGTLIDHFRDRVMFGIRNEHGTIAGFIGRALPDAGPAVPKYLNSPETSTYTKGDLLLGLYEARGQLARGAVPVIVEGPFDALAVAAVDPSRYAGLAPCGTALTSRQAAALGRVADLDQTGVVVALDGDRAGREAAIKAYNVLLTVTDRTTAVMLPASRDPAEILQGDGPAALGSVLHGRTQPLALVVIDAHLDSWVRYLDHPEGQLRAMRSAASLIASVLPADTAEGIFRISGGRQLATLTEDLGPIAHAELEAIARVIPASAACQIVRVADRLQTDCPEVITEVANVVTRKAADPNRIRGPSRNGLCSGQSAQPRPIPARLAMAHFPGSPSAATGDKAGSQTAPLSPLGSQTRTTRRTTQS
jgi:DNA primase catalytic core